jgi:myosin heavy subunit
LTNEEIAAQSPSSLTVFIDEACLKPNPLSPLNDVNVDELSKRKNAMDEDSDESEQKKPTIKPIEKPFAKQEIRAAQKGGPTDGVNDYLYPKPKTETPAQPRPTYGAKEILMQRKLAEQKEKEDAEKKRKEEEEAAIKKKQKEEEDRLAEQKRKQEEEQRREREKKEAEKKRKEAEEQAERERQEEEKRRKKEEKEQKREEKRKKEEEKARKKEEKKRKADDKDDDRETKKSKTSKEATASTRSKIQPVQPAKKREDEKKTSPVEKKESPNVKRMSPNGATMSTQEMRKVFDDSTKLARHIKHDADALASTNQITKAFTKYLRSTKMFYDAAILADEAGDTDRSQSIWGTTGMFLISLLYRFQKKIPHERERLGMIHVCIMLAAWKHSSYKAQRALTIHVDVPPILYATDMLNETKERGRKARSLTERLSTSNSPSVNAVDSPATSTTMVSPGVPPTNNVTANQPTNLLNVGNAVPSELQKDERYFRKVGPLIETSLSFEMFFYSMACAEQFLPHHMKPIPCMSQENNNFLSFMTKGVDPVVVNSYVEEWVTKFEYEDETR